MAQASDRWPDLGVLELLVGVAELGSLRAAAARAGVSQPSASTAIARFERRLGVKLLERTAQGSTTTSDGALFVDWSRRVLDAARELQVASRALRSDRESHLRVAASMTVAEYLAPRWLAAFQAERPTVGAELAVLNSDHVLEGVREGEHDLGFIESAQPLRGLHGAVVARDRLVVVVRPDHPWTRRRRRITPEELAGTALILREEGSGTRRTFVDALSGLGLAVVAPAQTLSSNAAVRVATMAGTAPAVLSELAVDDAVAAGQLAVVEVEGLDLSRSLRAVWTGGRRPLGNVADFVTTARADRPRTS
ncbi:LysR family transcriptional regulator [Knoellia koreensis]|uniref:LysR family transcriptional regulator n=1 Tax=Knoellia koreensis TaxID=2730921 RepID=A0A849HHB9_9MICO|nr:LysR family transcriptional regulator [Knoellia sp. DB2414S]NNM45974.1 LysR family transcriptional regulator [Knoellia sp. DB2414S]